MNDNSMSNEEKAKKFIEDVPTNFRELSGTKFSAARKHETLNRMFENLSQACNLNSQNSQSFFYRGRAFLFIQDYKRALYDFTASIDAETKYPEQILVKDKELPLEHANTRIALNLAYSGQCNHALGQYE